MISTIYFESSFHSFLFYNKLGWFIDRTGTSNDDGSAREMVWVTLCSILPYFGIWIACAVMWRSRSLAKSAKLCFSRQTTYWLFLRSWNSPLLYFGILNSGVLDQKQFLRAFRFSWIAHSIRELVMSELLFTPSYFISLREYSETYTSGVFSSFSNTFVIIT